VGLWWERASRLALNILYQFLDEDNAYRLHQKFKADFLVSIPYNGGVIKNNEIVEWIKENI
jgi:hypothetical protein